MQTMTRNDRALCNILESSISGKMEQLDQALAPAVDTAYSLEGNDARTMTSNTTMQAYQPWEPHPLGFRIFFPGEQSTSIARFDSTDEDSLKQLLEHFINNLDMTKPGKATYQAIFIPAANALQNPFEVLNKEHTLTLPSSTVTATCKITTIMLPKNPEDAYMGLENVKEWAYQAIAVATGPTEGISTSFYATIPMRFELFANGSFQLKEPGWPEVVISLQSDVQKLHKSPIAQDIGHIENPFWGDCDDTPADFSTAPTHSDEQFAKHEMANLPGIKSLFPPNENQGYQPLTPVETPRKRKRAPPKEDSVDVLAKKKQRASPAGEG